MSRLKLNRGGLMALEGLEDVVDTAAVQGQPVDGTRLDDAPAQADDPSAQPVTDHEPPEATGKVVGSEENSAVADADAIAVLDVKPEDHLLALEEAVGGVNELAEQIEEAHDVIETVEGINEQLDAAEQSEGVSPAAGEALRAVVEHFKNRMGFVDSEDTRYPALEAFGGKMSKKDAAGYTVKQNQQFVSKLKKAVRFAMEGLESKISETWALFWKSNESLEERLEEVTKAYDAGTVDEADLVDTEYAKALNVEGKDRVESGDVVQALLSLQELFAIDKFTDNLNTLGAALEAVVSGQSEGQEDSESVAKVKSLSEELQAQFSTLEAKFPAEKKEESVPVQPLQTGDKDQVVSIVQTLLCDDALSEAVSKVDAAVKAFEAGQKTEDLEALTGEVNGALLAGIGMMKIVVRYVYSTLTYVAESVRGQEPAEEDPPHQEEEADTHSETPDAPKEESSDGDETKKPEEENKPSE